MKIKGMDEREYNRFQMLSGQAEKAYETRQHSYRTEANYKQCMSAFTKYLAVESKLGNIENIKAKHVIGFSEKIKNKGLSASTQKTYLAAIRDFADRAGIDPRTIPSNSRLELDKRTFGNVDRAWTDREFEDFKELAQKYDNNKKQGPRMELILDLAKNFGCRLEGILNLDVTTIDKALKTRELWTKEKNGKNNIKLVETRYQTNLLKITEEFGKENGQRKIFIIENFKKTYKEVQNFVGSHNKDIQDQERMNTIDARNAFIETGKIHKGNLDIHGLRHNYARYKYKQFLEQGYTEKQAELKVSRLMGHNREQVTKIYLAK